MELAPGATEASAVTILTIAGTLGVLGLTAVLVALQRGRLRRSTGPSTGKPRPDRAHGLVVLIVVAAGMAALALRMEFARIHPGRHLTLFDLHGRTEPVYWTAFVVGIGLLTLLASATVRLRGTLGWALGGPALFAAALTMSALIPIRVKLHRLDATLVTEQLPARPSRPGVSRFTLGAYEGLGWWFAVLAVLLFAVVVVLACTRRHELHIAVAGTAALAAVAAAMPDRAIWLDRGTEVQKVYFWSVRYGPRGLLLPAALLVLAIVVCLIPVLPAWWRGGATIVVAGALVWTIPAGLHTANAGDRALPDLLADAGARVAFESAYLTQAMPYLLTMAAAPIVALRAWRASRRRGTVR